MIKKFHYKNNQYISYTEFGNPKGFPIIVNHGMIASIKNGDLFGDKLKASARIICVARPGYGESSPIELTGYKDWGDIVLCLAKELSLSGFDVFGSSAGAPYGYAVGYVCSDLVRNIYVYSGMPAFYDKDVQSIWPYPIEKNIPQREAEKVTYEMFFANAPKAMLENMDVKDSMNNNCFGPAQELRIRFEDWGFDLSEIRAKVFMQHSKQDEVIPYGMAEITSKLLPDCSFELLEDGAHFSPKGFLHFIEETIVPKINK